MLEQISGMPNRVNNHDHNTKFLFCKQVSVFVIENINIDLFSWLQTYHKHWWSYLSPFVWNDSYKNNYFPHEDFHQN